MAPIVTKKQKRYRRNCSFLQVANIFINKIQGIPRRRQETMEQSDSYNRLLSILDAVSPEDSAEALYQLIRPLGISGLVYSSGRLPGPLVEGSDAVRRWVAHFASNNYFDLDPLYSAAKKSVVPQFWHANQRRPNDTQDQANIYREIAKFGIAKGFDLSIHDHGDEASLCFYCEDARTDMDAARHMAQIGALYLHERIRQLIDRKPDSSTQILTPRERECLVLVQQGLIYAQVARRLNITERTVTFHLQNAKKKLGVSTLAQATAITLPHEHT